MALPLEKYYTVEDYYDMPEDIRAELIEGQIVYMAAPSTQHQRISSHLHLIIGNYINSKHGSCEVFYAPYSVQLREEDDTVVEPDIVVVCDPDKITPRGCVGAPDWIIEIVSPGSKAMDYFTKLFKYRTAGVREYWIIDPIKERVTVYFFERESVEEYSFGERVPVGIYEGFLIKMP